MRLGQDHMQPCGPFKRFAATDAYNHGSEFPLSICFKRCPIQLGLGLTRVTYAFLTSRPFSKATHPENFSTKDSYQLPLLSNEHISLMFCTED